MGGTMWHTKLHILTHLQLIHRAVHVLFNYLKKYFKVHVGSGELAYSQQKTTSGCMLFKIISIILLLIKHLLVTVLIVHTENLYYVHNMQTSVA